MAGKTFPSAPVFVTKTRNFHYGVNKVCSGNTNYKNRNAEYASQCLAYRTNIVTWNAPINDRCGRRHAHTRIEIGTLIGRSHVTITAFKIRKHRMLHLTNISKCRNPEEIHLRKRSTILKAQACKHVERVAIPKRKKA